jgi:hypothetical protein
LYPCLRLYRLAAKERDSYRRMINKYAKDLNNTNTVAININDASPSN